MITNVKTPVIRVPGEFAPMIADAVGEALMNSPYGLNLHRKAMSRPDGWEFGDRRRIAQEMGWPVYRVRRALKDLIAAGLYVVERIRDAAGRFSTRCRFLTSPQVTPEAGFPGVGDPARIPRSRERSDRRPGFTGSLRRSPLSRHSVATCIRAAAGKPCRECKVERESRQPSASISSSEKLPFPRPYEPEAPRERTPMPAAARAEWDAKRAELEANRQAAKIARTLARLAR